MKLPILFKEKMKEFLGEAEFNYFIESYNEEKNVGLRVNNLKIVTNDFERKSPFKLNKIPWVDNGFYISDEDKAGKHPYYYAGVYYIQEPSAMFPVEALDINPGEMVLDMCAAPGGKTLQIASKLNNKGMIITNDINKSRTKALTKNVELSGVKNSIVLNEDPKNLLKVFKGCFDKVLVDAPCSGEGMFRKDKKQIKSWTKWEYAKYQKIQLDLLEIASKIVKPGGTIVYSTCTFAIEENENVIESFVNKNHNFSIEEIDKSGGVCDGINTYDNKNLNKTARFWPHKNKAEGHFIAKLLNNSENKPGRFMFSNKYYPLKVDSIELIIIREFVKKNMTKDITNGNVYRINDNFYILNEKLIHIGDLNLIKFGLYLGTIKNKNFIPAHSLIMSLEKNDLKNVLDYSLDNQKVIKYLKGETLLEENLPNGYYGICVDGLILGWGKNVDGIIKNLYPKGWRMI